MRRLNWFGAALSILAVPLAGCERQAPVESGPPISQPLFDEIPCDDPAHPVEECPDDPIPIGGQPGFAQFFQWGSGWDLYEPPGDPSPGTPGIWLGAGTTPATCFASEGDADSDGLRDSCEYSLARSFAPVLSFHPSENCPGAEPYWAAKAMPYGFVNLAYLISYYRDCGEPQFGFGAHWGDSEMITVMVAFNSSTQHWETYRVWTSAHWNSSTDASRWTEAPAVHFAARNRAFPIIHVAENKHANYPDPSLCEPSIVPEWCGGNDAWFYGRVPVEPGRNIGSRYVDLVGCPHSVRLGTNRTECFYQSKRFAGWSDSPFQDNSAPYRDVLFGGFNFENFNPHWPPPPSWMPPFAASITGASVIDTEGDHTYSAIHSGGTGPYTYQWRVWWHYNSPGNWQDRGTGSTMTLYVAAGEGDFDVWVQVRSADGQLAGDRITVQNLAGCQGQDWC